MVLQQRYTYLEVIEKHFVSIPSTVRFEVTCISDVQIVILKLVVQVLVLIHLFP